jgi:hypothetical protein
MSGINPISEEQVAGMREPLRAPGRNIQSEAQQVLRS